MPQLTVQDAQLIAKWDSFLQDYAKEAIQQAALEFPDTRSVVLAFTDIQLRDPDLANYLLHKPHQALRVGIQAMQQVEVTVEPRPRLLLRVKGLPPAARRKVHDLRTEDSGRFVAIQGIVRKVSQILERVQEVVWECKVCTTRVHTIVDDEETFGEPVLCETCDAQRPWRIVKEESVRRDHQRIIIEDPSDGLDGGKQPEEIFCHVEDDLVGTVRLGDRIIANVLVQLQVRKKDRQFSSVWGRYAVLNSVEVEQQHVQDVVLTPERKEQLLQLAARPDIRELLLANFAPTIYGMDLAKEAFLLAAVGGVEREGGTTRQRGDIHVLLCGEPGLAKSQLLRYLTKLTPRAIFTTGKGSTANGLTVSAVQEPTPFGETEWMLRAGALVLADGSILAIDELGHLKIDDMGSLHQGMEQQEVSKSAAGITATMRSRTKVFGTCNPKGGAFEKVNGKQMEPRIDQVDMPPALLSRFDLILCLDDPHDKVRDEMLAAHIQTLRSGSAKIEIDHDGPVLSDQDLRDYLAYARTFRPSSEGAAGSLISRRYVEMRAQPSNTKSSARPIGVRQLEALHRLTEANARIHLRSEATTRDAEEAIALFLSVHRTSGMLDDDGRLDVSGVEQAVSRRKRSQSDRIRLVLEAVRDVARAAGGKGREADVLERCSTQGLSVEETRKALATLSRNHAIYQVGGAGTWAPMNP